MLILAVTVVAVRAGSTDTVDAAAGTINAVNVGTCYTTDDEVFTVDDCVDGDATAGYEVAGRDSITEVGTVYATYAHDPKTAPDSPRAILQNSNTIKINIKDTGRDKRTAVLLGAGNVAPCDNAPIPATAPATLPANLCGGDETTSPNRADGRADFDAHLVDIQKDYPGIKADFADKLKLAADAQDFRWIPRSENDTAGSAVTISGSGVETGFRIYKNGGTDDYKPMFVVDGDNSPITLYGNVTRPDGPDAGEDPDVTFEKLTGKYLVIDEDVGSGQVENEGENEDAQEVSPWFTIKTAVPNTVTNVTVLYVVYETSEFETLIGGTTKAGYEDKVDHDGVDTTPKVTNPLKPHVPAFTKTEEKSKSTTIVAEALSDGRTGKQQLRLHETSRFSGAYEGYLTLTDPNGDLEGWGLKTGNASSEKMDGAAILGVESGPVTIRYKDTDGKTREIEVAVDKVPPAIQIDQPAHESEGQDTSPEFAGSFTDDNSGLRDDSFRLYIDHVDDTNENGEEGTPALSIKVSADEGIYGTVDIPSGPIESIGDYAGYPTVDAKGNPVDADNEKTFGVVPHGNAFDLSPQGTSACGDADDDSLVCVSGDDHDDGALSGTFGDSARISFLGNKDYNHTIDFHALVADVAGNIGFSDSDDTGPNFINDAGEKSKDRESGKYNVLGWYARHIFFLDETDPVIFQEQSATGFYGENDDDEPQVSRSGVRIAFDRALDPDSVGVDTFAVSNDKAGKEAINIIDVDVQGRVVYLQLESELASDAKPYVDIVSGKWVTDPAGNRLTGGDQAPFQANDGITPKLTVTLSGGSGSGEGAEGPSQLTRNSIVISVEADEEINSTPSLVVVCSNIMWDANITDENDERDKELDDLVSARSGGRDESSASFTNAAEFDCGTGENRQKDVGLQQVQTYSRPGLSWEYEWVNFAKPKKLNDGKLTVVAYARDRQSYAPLLDKDGKAKTRKIDDTAIEKTKYSWGASTKEFRLDTVLNDPDSTPDNGDTVTEAKPFVLLEYDDKSTVIVDSFSVDGTAQTIKDILNNRYLYWPDSMELGKHSVSVTATDRAGNERTSSFDFTVAERKAFGVKLIAGWNAISFPANPIDPMIKDVFTNSAVDMIAGWDASDPEKPWMIATRMDGEWSTDEDNATLTRVHAKYGYWVHAQGFTTQKVLLIPGISRTDPNVVPPDLVTIPTNEGWNFVGVIDQDGDQTENHFGATLQNGVTSVTAGDYLGKNRRAYTWDAVRSKFEIVEADDTVKIGDGIWVYYAKPTTFHVAP